jgi:enolase
MDLDIPVNPYDINVYQGGKRMLGDLDIIKVIGRTVYDSWGNPAVEADVVLENGAQGRAIVPICDSQDEKTEIEILNNQLADLILFEDASDQEEIDRILLKKGMELGTGSKSILALSMAITRAAGAGLFLPLYRYLGGTSAPIMPVPMLSMISGGDTEKGIDFQDITVIPMNTKSYGEGLRMGTEIYHTLKNLLLINGYDTSTGHGGGFIADMKSTEEALHYIMESIKLAGYTPGIDAGIGIHVGADQLYKKEDGIYIFKKESRQQGLLIHRNQKDMMDFYLRLADGFPICSIINGLWNEDLKGREQIMGMLGHRVLLSFQDSIHSNGDIVELNQAGTVTAALHRVEQAKMAGHKVIIANDFIETEESFAGDLAAAVGADYVKCGAPCRGECTAKYNELLRIEEFYNRSQFL